MKNRLLVALLVVGMVLLALGAYAMATDDTKDPYKVGHNPGGGSSVGPATPQPEMELTAFTVQRGGDHDTNRVGHKLRLHKHVGDRQRDTSYAARGGDGTNNWCKPFHVWVTGPNPFTGDDMIRGDVSAEWCYDLDNNSIYHFEMKNTWCDVGPLVWDCLNPVPWDVVQGHGYHSSPRWEYIYRRVYFKFHGCWTFLGIPVCQTKIPYVNMTVRGNGEVVLGRGGL